ncbi:oxidoreductase [Klebsiella pneumoniae]|nr:oxidoreductase [Klebsiella pneumoniae]SUY89929.1 oxidoreductase [Klebsiella pneumoniae]
MQPQYNLLYREEEREMLPLCEDQGVGVIPWSPMARGRLTRDWSITSRRTQNDAFALKMVVDKKSGISSNNHLLTGAVGFDSPNRTSLHIAHRGDKDPSIFVYRQAGSTERILLKDNGKLPLRG